MLTDTQILEAIETGDIELDPKEGYATRIQPASLDVRLGDEFRFLDRRRAALIDPKVDQTQLWDGDIILPSESFTVHPNELVLATTYERIGLADDIVARVEGKSSLGRLGILVHATAGFIDPGWPLAAITLEISTVIDVPVLLYPMMPIGQLAFERLDQPVAQGYEGKYVRQQAPAVSRFHQNWTGSRWA